MLNTIAISLIPLIFCIASGFLLHRYRFVCEHTWQDLDKINYHFLFPSLLFSSLAFSDIKLNELKLGIVISLGLVGAISILAYLCHKLNYINQNHIGVYIQSLTRFNTYIGLALSLAVFDTAGLAIFSLIIAFLIPILNIIAVLALSQGNLAIRQIIYNLIKNPLIIACIIALIVNTLHIPIWQGIKNFLVLLASASLPLGLLCVGAALKLVLPKEDYLNLAANAFLRLMVIPCSAYIICTLAGIGGLERQIISLFFALPTAPSAYTLTKILGGNHSLMANIISFQTIAALISLPIVLWCILAI